MQVEGEAPAGDRRAGPVQTARTGPPIHPTMQERAITQAVALAEIAMTGPAAERDWRLAITPFEIVLLPAIVAAGFVAVGQFHQIAISEETE